MENLFGIRNVKEFSQMLARSSANINIIFRVLKTFAKFRQRLLSQSFLKFEHKNYLKIKNVNSGTMNCLKNVSSVFFVFVCLKSSCVQ